MTSTEFNNIISSTDHLKIQNELNIATAGKLWATGVSKNGREEDFWLAMTMELCELINSKQWKWWKDSANNAIDWDNVKVELIDVYHFLLSAQLMVNGGDHTVSIATTITPVLSHVGEMDNVYTNVFKGATALLARTAIISSKNGSFELIDYAIIWDSFFNLISSVFKDDKE